MADMERKIALKMRVCLFSGVLLALTAVDAGAVEDLAGHLLLKAGITKGICSMPKCSDAEIAVGIAKSSDFLVHVMDKDISSVNSARKVADREGLLGRTVIIEKGSPLVMPYADNLIDLVIITELSEDNLKNISLNQIMRVLRPRGRAVLGKANNAKGVLSASSLKKWLEDNDIKDAAVSQDSFGVWAVAAKPSAKGVDSWSHWAHGPDNNPVSTDSVVKWPFMTQWTADPFYVAMPVVTTVAAGRTFTATGHIVHHEREMPTVLMLTARNGYNGRVLWTRKLPTGYMVHRSAFIATEDIFYMIDGERCLMLDPETGKEKGSIQIPGVGGELKWIAMEDGILYALSGDSEEKIRTTRVRSGGDHWSWGALSRDYYAEPWLPWGYGNTLAAYDLNKKKALWTHRESKPVESRAVGISSGKLFFYCPNSRIGALDVKSGRLSWKNDEERTIRLIEEPGKGLVSTPGFRTTCMMVCSPSAIFIESQTRDNIVAISADNGKFLWKYKKTRSDPNMLFVDGKLIVGGMEGDGGTYVLDPLSGDIVKNLGFRKVNCTRLTGSPEAFFCRGEGLGIYVRKDEQYVIDGATRPGCNDGAIPANGLLYVGPWLCDCNLSMIGTLVLCYEGNFKFGLNATEEERLETAENPVSVKKFDTDERDWGTYRANFQRTAGIKVKTAAENVQELWQFKPSVARFPSPPSAAGDFVFTCGDDGKVDCIDAESGKSLWTFVTAGRIMMPPSIWNGRVYVGSGDGYIYCLEAVTGRMLWRFRASPVERRTMIYGSLCSTWPVNSGILISEGMAYAAAGVMDRDGTHVYALDAVTGKIKWQNNKTGHNTRNKKLYKGVSAQGIITIGGGTVWLAGGNQIGPAGYDTDTGKLVYGRKATGAPVGQRGSEMGVYKDKYLIYGGRLLYEGEGNFVTSSEFAYSPIKSNGRLGPSKNLFTPRLSMPPAWDDEVFIMSAYQYGDLTCLDGKVFERLLTEKVKQKDRRQADERIKESAKWKFPKYDVLSMAVTTNAVVAVCQRSRTKWFVCALDKKKGNIVWEQDLPSQPLLNGMLVDRQGRVIVTLIDGNIVCYGTGKK